MIVVDVNVLAYLWVPGPLTATASALLAEDPEWFAPPLWRSELRNVLLGHLRAGNGTLAAALAAMEGAEDQMGGSTVEVESRSVLTLAARSGCSAYDCEYAALALQLGTHLATADRKLAGAFPELARLVSARGKESR